MHGLDWGLPNVHSRNSNAFQILGLIIALSQLQYISVYVRKRHHQAKRGIPGETEHIFQILELKDEKET